MAESCDSSDDGCRRYPDFKWSRSVSERVRGIRDSTLNRVSKKFRENKLAGKAAFRFLFIPVKVQIFFGTFNSVAFRCLFVRESHQV